MLIWTQLRCSHGSFNRYSGVQRSQNAYVPPGARRALGGGQPAPAPASIKAIPVQQKLSATPASFTPAANGTATAPTQPSAPTDGKDAQLAAPAVSSFSLRNYFDGKGVGEKSVAETFISPLIGYQRHPLLLSLQQRPILQRLAVLRSKKILLATSKSLFQMRRRNLLRREANLRNKPKTSVWQNLSNSVRPSS